MESHAQYLAIPEGELPSPMSGRSAAFSIIEMEDFTPSLPGSHEDHAADASDIVGPSGASDTTFLPATSDDCALEEDYEQDGSWTLTPMHSLAVFERFVLDTWACEIAATVFSVGCMIAIAIIVGHYNDGPIPRFSLGITLNAMISVLSTAARTALILVVSAAIGQLRWCWFTESGRRLQDLQTMDDASRGPLGAIGMIATWTGGALATLGGIVMISTIAFGPCLQQLVEYFPKDVNQTERAFAPRVLNYTLLHPGAEDAVTQDLTSVIGSGLTFNSDLFIQYPRCPTADCSWGEVKSVGWCSKCKDLSRNISTKLQNCEVGEWLRIRDEAAKEAMSSMSPVNGIIPFPQLQSDQRCKVDTGNSVIPLLTVINRTHNEDDIQDSLYGDHKYNPPESDILFNSIVGKADTFAYLVESIFLRRWEQNEIFHADDGTQIKSPLMVFDRITTNRVDEVFRDPISSEHDALEVESYGRCALTLCETTRTFDVNNGTTIPRLVATAYGTYYSDSGIGLCWKPHDGDVNLINHEGNRVDFEKRAFCHVDGYPAIVDKVLSTNSTFYWYFNRSHGSGNVEDFPGRTDNPTSNSRFRYFLDSFDNDPSRGLASLKHRSSRNLSVQLEGVVAALTTYGLGKSSDAALGSVFSSETWVRARWEWIILPALSQFASLILLVSTMIHSRRKGVPLWKSSVLATCYHRVQTEGTAELSLEKLSGMRTSARREVLQSSGTKGNPRFMFRRASAESQTPNVWPKLRHRLGVIVRLRVPANGSDTVRDRTVGWAKSISAACRKIFR